MLILTPNCRESTNPHFYQNGNENFHILQSDGVSRQVMYSRVWVLIQMFLFLQVLLKVAKGLLVEKLESTLIEQLEEAVHRREILYVSCYTRVCCEVQGRSTTTAATAANATGGGATRRGVAISSVCGGGAASTHHCASRGAACVCS